MKNKKVIFIVLGIVIIFAIFIVSFIIGSQLLNMVEEDAGEVSSKMQNINENTLNTVDKKSDITKKQKDSFDGVILKVEGSDITVLNPSHLVDYSIYEGDMDWHNGHSVVSDGKLCVTASYLMCLDNVQIKDKNGNKIGVSDLKPGDNVKIFTKNIEYTASMTSMKVTSENIELVEVVTS